MILGRNNKQQVDRIPLKVPCGDMGAKKGKREGWGFSRLFGIEGRLLRRRRPARRAISSVVERAPDNCVVVPGL